MRSQTRRDYVGAYGFLIQSFDQRAWTRRLAPLEPRVYVELVREKNLILCVK